MMKSLVAALLLSAPLVTFAQPGFLKCENEILGQVGGSSLLKTYTREYWKIARRETKNLPAALLKVGFVVGDFHYNNVGLYFDRDRSQAEILVNDFDDAGSNLLLVDFFKYLNFVQKTDKNVDQDQLLHNYVAGLRRQSLPPPAELAVLLQRDQKDFRKEHDKYIENRREEFSLFDKHSLNSAQLAQVEKLSKLKLIRELNGLDYMVSVNDSGSSMNAQRIEFMGTDNNGITGVIEFKQLKCAATGNETEQNLTENFNYVKKFFNSNFPSSEVIGLSVYRLDDTHQFLVREKKKNALKKIGLEKLPTSRIQAVSNYYAAYLGRLHSPSADAAYINAVIANKEMLLEKARSVGKIFKDTVKN